MRIIKAIIAIFIILTVLTSCDDGKIFDDTLISQEEGVSVVLTGELDGVDRWSDEYNIAVAGFGDSEYAVISKNVTTINNETDQVELIMSGVTSQVKTIELCGIDRLRKRVITFKSISVDHTLDTLYFEVGKVDVGMFSAIQKSVFNVTCSQCHGGSNFAAAGLYLTEGRSYEALVNKPSIINENEILVLPGDALNSTLYNILSSNVTSTWKYDHSVEVLSTTTLDLIKSWIDTGAEK